MLEIAGLNMTRGQGGDAFSIQLPSLQLAQGETLAIAGLSGTGKSTLLEMIGLVLAPHRIERFQFTPSSAASSFDIAQLIRGSRQDQLAQIRARHIGFVLQTGGLLPFLTVAQNLLLPRQLNGLPPKSALLAELSDALGVTELMARKPRELSVGQRQRVAFVRALSHEPSLLLADEPTAALDPYHGQRLFEKMLDVVGRHQVSAIVVTHNEALIEHFGLPVLRGDHLTGAAGSGAVFR
ncbi:ABC transporter ATP-binding protein [Ketobacter sp.]|uniref:ABC transporter ATP-binding protein n=1 Tax=Ketobacter sp. TaxID=2083498 RepID=UPI000F123EE9|nr:ABC transporter ATP-binding protein [Ketobacter sp.]RLT93812.1 MAG: ABC transporter ATP-binding protein [Ketobacter sp.]